MATTLVTSNPSFEKEYNNVLRVEDLSIYWLYSNRDSLPIPTDSDGNTPDFTDSIVTFYVKLANEDKTSEWTISEFASTNCTITVSDVNKTATVTAISANVGHFTIKASKLNENPIYRKITVFKSKAGVDGTDGTGTPDGVTIITDGSGNLKVEHNDVYNDTNYTNGLSIGFGGLAGTRNLLSTNIVNLSPSTNSTIESSDYITIVGDCDLKDRFGSGVATFTNGVVCGNDIILKSSKSSPFTTSNFAVFGTGNNAETEIRDNTVIVGCDPRSTIDGSLTLSLPSISPGFVPADRYNRQIVFKNQTAAVEASTPTTINLPMNTEAKYVKIITDIYGFDAADTGFDKMVQKHTTVAIDGGMLVNYSNSNDYIALGIFNTEVPGTGISCIFDDPSKSLVITIPSLSKTTKWYITHQIQLSL
jgi:hypothetical protein